MTCDGGDWLDLLESGFHAMSSQPTHRNQFSKGEDLPPTVSLNPVSWDRWVGFTAC